MKTINRRAFIKTAVAGGILGAAGPTRSAFGLGYPIGDKSKEDIGSSIEALLQGKSDAKIKSIESFTDKEANNLSFVRVVTEDGTEGWGQMAPFNADISAIVLHRNVAPLVIGKDPYDFGGISDLVRDRNLKYPWSYVCRALSGLDTALWDLRGKQENKSICELLGGTPGAIPVYGSSMSRKITAEEEARRMVALRESHGFRAFKIRIGSEAGHNQDAWPGRTEEIVPTVRKALGEDVGLMVDANSCYTIEKAIEVGKMLEKNKVIHFEEPCPYWEFEWASKVNKALKVPVTGGEQNNDPAQWQRILNAKAYDIIQPDVCYLGGLTRTLRVVAMAHKAKVPVVPHSANLSLVTVFALHLMGAIPNAGPHVEYTIESNPWTRELYQPVLKVRDGKVAVPNNPGWGVVLNKTWLENAQHQITA
ncbi:MAG: mandelate racemase/muconate lactonizing enzyme family protein [Sedimentisphaerales bacterium]|nr:mandelate racemase/muconate lactonizing enzyme family protein [Sedimentisphaerales bacterium]